MINTEEFFIQKRLLVIRQLVKRIRNVEEFDNDYVESFSTTIMAVNISESERIRQMMEKKIFCIDIVDPLLKSEKKALIDRGAIKIADKVHLVTLGNCRMSTWRKSELDLDLPISF